MDQVPAGVEVRRFAREDLQAVVELCAAESWSSYSEDPQRTLRALTAAGSVTLVAVAQEVVVGVVQLQSDGEIQAHLTMIVVARQRRERGIARALLTAALRQAGGMRIDLLSTADGFYRRLGAQPFPGFRVRGEQLLGD